MAKSQKDRMCIFIYGGGGMICGLRQAEIDAIARVEYL